MSRHGEARCATGKFAVGPSTSFCLQQRQIAHAISAQDTGATFLGLARQMQKRGYGHHSSIATLNKAN